MADESQRMTPDELAELLAGNHLAVISTIGPDGYPQSTPVWYLPDGEAVGIMGLLGGDPWHVLEISHGYFEHRREVRLVCRDGSAVLRDAYADHIEVARAGSPQPEPERRPISREMPLLLELRAFVEHLQGGPPPRSPAAPAPRRRARRRSRRGRRFSRRGSVRGCRRCRPPRGPRNRTTRRAASARPEAATSRPGSFRPARSSRRVRRCRSSEGSCRSAHNHELVPAINNMTSVWPPSHQ